MWRLFAPREGPDAMCKTVSCTECKVGQQLLSGLEAMGMFVATAKDIDTDFVMGHGTPNQGTGHGIQIWIRVRWRCRYESELGRGTRERQGQKVRSRETDSQTERF